MTMPLAASGKTVKEDSELFFAVTRSFSLPGVSSHYAAPHAFGQLMRSRLRQRNRFNHDHHDTFVYIERSKNANVVAYTANLVDAATNEKVGSGIGRQCVLRSDDPVHAYFVNLEPSYVEDRRRKGIEYDCDDLNMLERTLAYGFSATPVNTEDILQYWGRHTPEAFAALQAEWKAGGSVGMLGEGQGSTGDETAAPLSAIALTVESVGAALKTWWAPFHPYISHFVAAPTYPTLILCLPPVAKLVGSSRCSSVAASAEQIPTAPNQGRAADTMEEKPPTVDKTNVTYGSHTEPAEATATSGVLSDEDTVVATIALIGGELSVLEKVYVKSIEPKRFYNLPKKVYVASVEPKHFYQLPKVEYVEVHGTSLETGAPTYEKRRS
ncbi:hypothetical protein LSCM4_05806 [Leishmania orientalis]|uniref:DUF4833 domain-containing protein n=1 Tax=Leishmania orientalis TaxID=2249476 RepID=A0A836KVN0_9TRYP|nr:hypothetical protein LSCM4_05806 [Leishmania orientalis]